MPKPRDPQNPNNPTRPGASAGPRPPRGGRRSGKGGKLYDSVSGFHGWTQHLPGRRDVVTPCVVDGRVLLGGGFGSHSFYAFDARNGDLLWGHRVRDDGPTSAVSAEGYVVFNTESCTVCALSAETGEPVWEHWLGDPLLAQPAIGEGRVFMVWPTRGQHRIGAFDLATGQPLWSRPIEADVITAPVFSEGLLYATTYDGSVHCWSADEGHPHWTRAMRATSAPWVWKGEIFVAQREPGAGRRGDVPLERLASVDRGHYRSRSEPKHASYLSSRRGTAAGHSDWEKDQRVGFGSAPSSAKLHHAESLTGSTTVSRAWSFQGSRPCVWDGRVYSVVGDELTASSLESGRELWKWNARFDDEGERGITPPAVSNGRVYAGTRDGRVLSWDAEGGALRWKVDIGTQIVWQPVVSGGRVFVGCVGGRLVALSTEDPGDDGWPMWGGGPGHNGQVEAAGM